MANRQTIKDLIVSTIYDNLLRKITAPKHQELELQIMDSVVTKEDDIVNDFSSEASDKVASAGTVKTLNDTTLKLGRVQTTTAWIDQSTIPEGDYDVTFENAGQNLFGYTHFKVSIRYLNLGTEYIQLLESVDGRKFRRSNVLNVYGDFEEVTVGDGGGITSIVAGENVEIDYTDPKNPRISFPGGIGTDGVGIVSIAKTGTVGLVDTYTITYTDGTTSTYTVTNGENGGGGTTVNEYTNKFKDKKIYLYGDSLFSIDYPWISNFLTTKLLANVVIGGHSGASSHDLTNSQWLDEIIATNPDVIICLFGGNEKGTPGTVGTFLDVSNEPDVSQVSISSVYSGTTYIQAVDYCIRYIMDKVYISGKRLIVLNGLPQQRTSIETDWSLYDNNLRKVNAVEEACRRNNIPCIDAFGLCGFFMPSEPFWTDPTDKINSRGINTMDGLHLNQNGSDVLTEVICDFLRKFLIIDVIPSVGDLAVPSGFSPLTEEINIIDAFNSHPDILKKYIYSVSSNVNSVQVSNLTESFCSEMIGGLVNSFTNTSGTINFTAGSTKRYVIVSGDVDMIAFIPSGAIWTYVTSNPNNIVCGAGNDLKCVQLSSLSSLVSISDNAFKNCTGLTKINLPISVLSIGNNAFQGCNNLVFNSDNLILNLNNLGHDAFDFCYELKSIDLRGGNLSMINSASFYNCTGLTLVQLSNSITIISEGAFSGCTGLINISLPSQLDSIGNNAFYGCVGLASIVLPSLLSIIGNSAFYNCTALVSISLPISLQSIGSSAFQGCSNLVFNADDLILNASDLLFNAFALCSKLKSVNLINSTITKLSNSLFYGCSLMNSLTIPVTVTELENGSLTNCSSLSLLKVKNSTPATVLSNTFSSINKTTCMLHVPSGSLAAYQAAQYWNEFTNIIADL